MKKFYMVVVLTAALLLGACSSERFAGSMPDVKDPVVPAEPVVVEPGIGNESYKEQFEPEEKDIGGKSPDSVVSNVPHGITINRIKFEILLDDIPSELEALIDKNKENQGFSAIEIDGEWYVAVFMGERLTGGFAVEVGSIEDSEGRTNIFVNETMPAEDAILLMALTYPCQIVKINDGIAPNFTVVNQDGVEYPEVE